MTSTNNSKIDPQIEKLLKEVEEVLKNNGVCQNKFGQTNEEQDPTQSFLQNQNALLNILDGTDSILKYVSDDLRNDRNFMLKAIKCDERSIDYISEDLMCDKDFLLKVIDVAPWNRSVIEKVFCFIREKT